MARDHINEFWGLGSLSLQQAFVNKMEAQLEDSLQFHVDESKFVRGKRLEGYQVMSAVFVINKPGNEPEFSGNEPGNEVSGGQLCYSICACGEIDERNNHKARNTRLHTAESNSIYSIPGSYVRHGVKKVTSGVRYSFVFFFDWPVADIEFIKIWTGKPFVCVNCCCCFVSEKGLLAHYSFNPVHVKFMCSRTRYNFMK